MTTEKRSAALRKLTQLAAKVDKNPIDFAELLWEYRTQPAGRHGERLTFDEIAAATEKSRRTLHYSMAVWERFKDLCVPRDRLDRIGWTKLAIIAKHRRPGLTLMSALKLADKYTASELPRRLRGEAGQGETHCIMLRFDQAQYDRFSEVLKTFGASKPKKGQGLANKEKALMKALAAIPAN